jgi:hypothetical protein
LPQGAVRHLRSHRCHYLPWNFLLLLLLLQMEAQSPKRHQETHHPQ